ncbi:hypothetical protein HPB50_027672 [Hyalomma asiaticum]|nr:hypothetical protein HPB50_027672 [Hyalomma asiaticum]
MIQHRLDSFESVIRNLREENARFRKEVAVLKGETPSATLPPLQITPVSAESVKNAEEVMKAQVSLHPLNAEAKSQKREEQLRERVEALEDKVNGMLAQKSQQNAQLNRAIAQQTAQTEKLASAVGQLTQMVASLQARIDDIEMRLPGGAGRPWNCRGYRRKRGHLQQFLRKRERPDVILLQETNDAVKLAGYKAIDEAVTPREHHRSLQH